MIDDIEYMALEELIELRDEINKAIRKARKDEY